jgi:hypothetical protein
MSRRLSASFIFFLIAVISVHAAGSFPMAVLKHPGAETSDLAAGTSGRSAALCDLRGRRLAGTIPAHANTPATASGYYITGTPREQRIGSTAMCRR